MSSYLDALRAKAKAVGVLGWATLDQENLEFWIAEHQTAKERQAKIDRERAARRKITSAPDA